MQRHWTLVYKRNYPTQFNLPQGHAPPISGFLPKMFMNINLAQDSWVIPLPKTFWPPLSSRRENFSKTFIFANFLDFPGYGRASQGLAERNVEQCVWSVSGQNKGGASAPLCIVLGRLSTFRATQPWDAWPYPGKSKNVAKKKCFRKVYSPRTEWGSKCIWQRYNTIILGQIFVRKLFGRNPELGRAWPQVLSDQPNLWWSLNMTNLALFELVLWVQYNIPGLHYSPLVFQLYLINRAQVLWVQYRIPGLH